MSDSPTAPDLGEVRKGLLEVYNTIRAFLAAHTPGDVAMPIVTTATEVAELEQPAEGAWSTLRTATELDAQDRYAAFTAVLTWLNAAAVHRFAERAPTEGRRQFALGALIEAREKAEALPKRH